MPLLPLLSLLQPPTLRPTPSRTTCAFECPGLVCSGCGAKQFPCRTDGDCNGGVNTCHGLPTRCLANRTCSSGAGGELCLFPGPPPAPPRPPLRPPTWAPVDPLTGKLLFLDRQVLQQSDDGIVLEMHPPVKRGRVLAATEPWEADAVYAFHSVVQVNRSTVFLYYDVTSGPAMSVRYTALAVSHDAGLSFAKPRLGLCEFNGSRDNNLVWPLTQAEASSNSYPGAAFLDSNPASPPDQRFKMTVGGPPGSHPDGGYGSVWLLCSADGLRWRRMHSQPVVEGSDTQNVLVFNPSVSGYTGYIRIDDASPPEHNRTCPAQIDQRRIGRCELGLDLSPPWPCRMETADATVLSFESDDDMCADIYTSAATVYHGSFLFFPAVFSHMVFASKPSSPNDGLLAGTLAVSRDGVTASWVDAPNGRDAFLPLGVNRCEDLQLGVYPPRTAWCANSDTMAASDFE